MRQLDALKQGINDAFMTLPAGLTLTNIEQWYIWFILKKHGWNRSKSCKALGMCRRSISRKIWELRMAGIEVPEYYDSRARSNDE